jgi:hypothetical protein
MVLKTILYLGIIKKQFTTIVNGFFISKYLISS